MEEEGKISFAFSFVSGFVDTAGFIALFGVFTAHVTGNLVLAGASFIDQSNMGNLTPKLLMLPIFVIAVMMSSYCIKYRHAKLSSLLLWEVLFIACFAIAGIVLQYTTSGISNSMILFTASFAVAGMAIQNTYMRKLLGKYTANTEMTGNFTQFAIYISDLYVYCFRTAQCNTTEKLDSVLKSLRIVTNVLTGFLMGCSFGALLVSRLGLVCCLLPALVLFWIRAKLNKNALN